MESIITSVPKIYYLKKILKNAIKAEEDTDILLTAQNEIKDLNMAPTTPQSGDIFLYIGSPDTVIFFPAGIFPAGIFRPIKIQYIHIRCCCVCVVLTFIFRPEFSGRIFRPIQIQYKFIVFVLYSLSGRNIPSNTNTIHTHSLLL